MDLTELLTRPQLFAGLIILWLIIFSWIIYKIFDVIMRSYVERTSTKTDDRLLSAIRRCVLLAVLVTGAYSITLNVDLPVETHTLIESLFISTLIIITAFFVSDVISMIVVELNERQYRKQGQQVHAAVPFLNAVFKIVILSISLLWIMRIYKVDITPALASAGVLGVAVAFAAKDFVANLFGGLSVFFDRPYSIGDYVIVDQIHRGEVQEIGMRSTKIRTRDGVLITVPNSVMVTNVVVNETGYDSPLRVRIPIPVALDSDLERVEKVLLDIAKEHSEVMTNPEPLVRYRSFTESGVSLEFLIVIQHPADKGRISHELIKLIHIRFIKEKISIPYPHQHIMVEKI
jgi:small-conductance mechanosensitive channel